VSEKQHAPFLTVSKGQFLPVDECITLLSLLQEVHEFAFSLSQVDVDLVIAIKLLAFVLGQPLVGIHNLETHLFVISSLTIGGIWMILFVI